MGGIVVIYMFIIPVQIQSNSIIFLPICLVCSINTWHSSFSDEEPSYERPSSADKPRNLRRREEDHHNTHSEFSSKSLPRNSNGYTHPEYSSKSLPRQRTKSTSVRFHFSKLYVNSHF